MTRFLPILFLALSSLAQPASVTLAWGPSLGTNVAGYNAYWGTASRTYGNKLNVGNATNAIISGLIRGTNYFFAATSYDKNGQESDYNEWSYRIPIAPITNLIVVTLKAKTSTNILGPWVSFTNLVLYSATNPSGKFFLSATLQIERF